MQALLNISQNALENGFIYALVGLALFLSFSILNITDLTTDGSFTLGCAVSAVVCIAGHPILALPVAMLTCAMAGFVTAFLQTRLGVPGILAGIVTNIGLYTVNLLVMGSSNKSIVKKDTIFTLFKATGIGGRWYVLVLAVVITLCVCLLLTGFLKTRLGLSIRATGDNRDMVRASSINPVFTITVGLCLANAMTGLAGALIAQYTRSADINMGTGMAVIGLASLVIGETLVGKGSIRRRVFGVLLGSIVYRAIFALALRMNMSMEYMKLVSAVIVGGAIAAPSIRQWIVFERQKRKALAERSGRNASGQ